MKRAVIVFCAVLAVVIGLSALAGCKGTDLKKAVKESPVGQHLGGVVKNSEDSGVSVRAYNQWSGDNWNKSNEPGGKGQSVAPGKASTYKDADGFCAPKKHVVKAYIKNLPFGQYEVTVQPGECYKISDGQVAVVEVASRKA